MIIKCAICSKEVETKYSGTKYCEACSKEVRKKRDREKWRRKHGKGKYDDLKKFFDQKSKESKRKSQSKPKKNQNNNNKKRNYVYTKHSICWDCENVYGGCPWTEVDSITNKIKFQPVPGWVAEKTVLKVPNNGKSICDYSYIVKECPLFIKSPERRAN